MYAIYGGSSLNIAASEAADEIVGCFTHEITDGDIKSGPQHKAVAKSSNVSPQRLT